MSVESQLEGGRLPTEDRLWRPLVEMESIILEQRPGHSAGRRLDGFGSDAVGDWRLERLGRWQRAGRIVGLGPL